MNTQTWLRPEQAFEPLGYKKSDGLYRALREGLLPDTIRVLRIGRQYRLNRDDVLGLQTTNGEFTGPTTNQEPVKLAA